MLPAKAFQRRPHSQQKDKNTTEHTAATITTFINPVITVLNLLLQLKCERWVSQRANNAHNL